MQREIKFRAWNHDEEVMMSQMLLSWDGNRFYNEVDNELTITQYTGLKDKNGVEIYEGDVLQNTRYKNSKAVVEWGERFCRKEEPVQGIFGEWIDLDGFMGSGCVVGFILSHIGSNKSFYVSNLDYQTVQAEVIGNIYENPELLTN